MYLTLLPFSFFPMARTLLIYILVIYTFISSYSMPAYPGKIVVTVGEKEFFIRLFGDEHSKWAETEDGYSIIQNASQEWCYAQLNDKGYIEASPWKLQTNKIDNDAFCQFLSTTPKHLSIPKNVPQTEMKASARAQVPKAAIGERRILIILMEYKDLSFTKSQNDFHRLFNEEKYNDDGAQGSVRDFYLSASYNQLILSSDVYGPYTTSKDMSYYGKNAVTGNKGDMNAYALFEEAIQAVAQDTNLKQYDGDGDGFIDNVHIIFAGYGEEAGASANAIWSHEATFYRPYEIQGLKIDRYSCAPELRGNSGKGISRIGPHCHEIGHALGSMDYYDTNYATGGEYFGTGKWDVMASGSWNDDGITPADFNPYVKAYNYGWISPKSLEVGNVMIRPSNDSPNDYYMLRSSDRGDYYLLENRSKTKWGRGLPGEGLLIYHIHYDLENSGNEINATAPQKCYIVCASSKTKKPNEQPSSYGEINSAGCPYPGSSVNHSFSTETTPIAFYWNGEDCGIRLSDIVLLDNGDIQLLNESEDSGYLPLPTKNIFYEDFENDLSITIEPSNSRQWTVVENPENTSLLLDRPIAYEGVNSLQLSAYNQYYAETNAFTFSCNSLNDEGRIRLKIYYTSFNVTSKKKNTLKIGYKNSSINDWNYTEIESSENQLWKQIVIDIPIAEVIDFRIEGRASIGCILAVDNLYVEQEIEDEETAIRPTSFRITNETCDSYYSLDGIRRKKPHKGINIINRDGKVIKIIY